MGNNFYGVPYIRNSVVTTDSQTEDEIVVNDIEVEDSVVSDVVEQEEINVYGGVLNPELPKVLDNEQINVYVPVAGKNFPGISYFNPAHFDISVSGFVSLLKGGIEKIEKVSSRDGIDLWAIYLTDNRVEYFTIENGKPGTPGITPQMRIGADYTLQVSYDNGATWSTIGDLPPGPVGPKGDNFEIKKVYTSVSQMNASFSTDGVPIGGLVLINTNDVEHPDNAKLYVKHEDSYHYLTDMSGSRGIQGPPGYTPVKGHDYYTDQEREQMIRDILEQIPYAEDVSV